MPRNHTPEPAGTSGGLATLQQTWSDLARKDAMWAVLTGPLGASRTWDPKAFFLTGAAEVESVLERVALTGAGLRFGRALDFGCGPGRLTQALAARFDRVDGVDIAAPMIEKARALNRAGDRCTYHLNPAGDLRIFADDMFDFVYSNITLQHMEPQFSRGYIAEFVRVARPGGVIVFQVPSEPVPVERPRTRQAGPLPPASCRARFDGPKNLRCAPGATLPLRIMVRNDGDTIWSASDREDDARYAIRVGNHWRSRFGFMRRFDDRRAGLPFDVAPGETIEIGIHPQAPAAAGVHVLELDVVQEYVRWFSEAGSPTSRIRITVDAKLAPGAVQGLPAQMEMHGIPRADVEALVRQSGAMLLVADPDDAPGPGWTSFRYVAQKPDPQMR